ncbi:hypothetical protein E2I00_015122, partial [Balaenoptera physalus]
MPPSLTGYYCFVSQKNLEDYLRALFLEFEVEVQFEEDLRITDGRKCQTIVTWEEEQLVCVEKGEVPNRGWRHWLEGETLYLVS